MWNPELSWGVANARRFYLSVKPYCLGALFDELCTRYRWVKFNYVSMYVNVCSYNTVAPALSEVKLKLIEKVQSVPARVEGEIQTNTPFVSPLLGQNHMIFGWNLDSTTPSNKFDIEVMERSTHTKTCKINGNKYCKFFYRFSAEVRRYVGCDHVRSVQNYENLNEFIDKCVGQAFRRMPTDFYGVVMNFLKDWICLIISGKILPQMLK